MEACKWPQNSEAMLAYHNTEWGFPSFDDRYLFEMLSLEGAQAGLSWSTILNKREVYKAAFHNFDIKRCALLTDEELIYILENFAIIKNKLKVFSVRKNARLVLNLQEEYGSFSKYLWKFTGGNPVVNSLKEESEMEVQSELSVLISKDLKKRGFSFVGPVIIYSYLQAIGMIDDHVITCPMHTTNREKQFELSQNLTGGVTGEMIITEGMPELIRQAAGEGIVLLKNTGVLPFQKQEKISVFGRVQVDYFSVGYGSGGDVRCPYVVNLLDGLRNSNEVTLNEELAHIYEVFSKDLVHKINPGTWGNWPTHYPEMPLSEKQVKNAAKFGQKAILVIGRAAGEDRENQLIPGSYYLTEEEKRMLDLVTTYFSDVVLIMNCGNIIDMSWLHAYEDKIAAILYTFLGGMESGNSVADILTGKVNPSGKLADTIAIRYEDYPSAANFGNVEKNDYAEDIYVGYRYFETFAKEKVLYPFGFGLSYTTFQIALKSVDEKDGGLCFKIHVTNTGLCAGKEVVQIYVNPPQGKLGKPLRNLCAFGKTPILKPKEEVILTLNIDWYQMSSYDDSGISGAENSYVLEEGNYDFYLGNQVQSTKKVYSHVIKALTILKTVEPALCVEQEHQFMRLKALVENEKVRGIYEKVPVHNIDLRERILKQIPAAIPMTKDQGYQLQDVANGRVSLEQFLAQLSLEELEALTRGEGPMNSSQGVEGNAGVLGGVTESLRNKGIPPVITADGPAGIRIQKTCSLIPCGTLLACTFNTQLVEDLFTLLSSEILDRQVDMILSPGMNIHRDPLCGRNFEYFTEDPLLCGHMAIAAVRGIQHNQISACPKHFACNNQETNRNKNDSRVSERALREIYLKPFEWVITYAKPKNIMTSYNKINGVWSHYNFDLNTQILRNEWGYEGTVITDWWMQYADSKEFPKLSGNAYRVRAQVDVLMPGSKEVHGATGENDGTLLQSLGQTDGITLGEIQRSAANILKYTISTNAMIRSITNLRN